MVALTNKNFTIDFSHTSSIANITIHQVTVQSFAFASGSLTFVDDTDTLRLALTKAHLNLAVDGYVETMVGKIDL